MYHFLQHHGFFFHVSCFPLQNCVYWWITQCRSGDMRKEGMQCRSSENGIKAVILFGCEEGSRGHGMTGGWGWWAVTHDANLIMTGWPWEARTKLLDDRAPCNPRWDNTNRVRCKCEFENKWNSVSSPKLYEVDGVAFVVKWLFGYPTLL